MLPVRIRHRLRPAVTRRIAQRCAKHTLSAFSADDRLANEPVQSAACQLRSLGGCGVEVHESLEVITHGVDHRAGHRGISKRPLHGLRARAGVRPRGRASTLIYDGTTGNWAQIGGASPGAYSGNAIY
jgi:hypothetical protein